MSIRAADFVVIATVARATQNTGVTCSWTVADRVVCAAEVGNEPVAAPCSGNCAVHVVDAPCVRHRRSHVHGRSCRAIARVTDDLTILGKRRRRGVGGRYANVERRSRSGAAGILPLGLGRDVKGELKLLANGFQQGAVAYRVDVRCRPVYALRSGATDFVVRQPTAVFGLARLSGGWRRRVDERRKLIAG